jgi:hypothetical protein
LKFSVDGDDWGVFMMLNATFNNISVISTLSVGFALSSINKTDHHDITEILEKV